MDDQPAVGEVDVSSLTVDEAKDRIAWLRDQKKVLAIRRRELTSEKADENARWRERQAGRIRGVKKSGFLGSVIQSNRRSESMDHADRINRIVAQHQAIDADVREIDHELRDLEGHVRAQPKASRAAAASSAPAAGPDHAQTLLSLKSMLDQGIITQAEYDAKKTEILARI